MAPKEHTPASISATPAIAMNAVAWAAAGVGALALLVWIALRPAAVQIDVGAVSRGPMKVTVDEEGKTRIKRVFVVSAPVTGKLRRSPLDPGDEVVANETVMQVMEPTPPVFLDTRTRQEAEAAVGAAQAAVALAEAEVKQAETELTWAGSELQRARSLVQTNAVSARTFERANLEHQKQTAAVARSKANLALRKAELASATAKLIGPETRGAGSEQPAACCVEVRSPHSGKVLRELQESERVVLAGTPLFEIGDPHDLDVVVELLSTDVARISEGAPAIVEGAGLAVPLDARVRRIEPAGFTKVSALGIEEQRVKVFLDVLGAPQALSRLGHDYRTFVRVEAWSKADAVRVPSSALFRHGSRWALYTVRNGRAALVDVEVGHLNNEHAEILRGIEAGQSVILHPSDRISDGVRVSQRRTTASP